MIYLILILSLILRIISLNQSLWLDEAINVMYLKSYSFTQIFTSYIQADFHPPGYLLILWVWERLFGISEISVRFPSVVFGVATVYFIYLIGTKLFSSKVGIISALLLAVNPLHIYYSQEARMYAFAALAVSIQFYFFVKLIKQDNKVFWGLLVGGVLVLLSDYLAYLIFIPEFLYLLWFEKQRFVKWLKPMIVILVVLTLWLPLLYEQLSVGTTAAQALPGWSSVVGGVGLKEVLLTPIKFIIGRISYADKTIYYGTLSLIGIFFTIFMLNSFRKIEKRLLALLLLSVFIPIIISQIISSIIPIYSYFRVLYLLIPFLLLVAIASTKYPQKVTSIIITVIVCIELIASSIYLLNPAFHREDWRAMVAFLKQSDSFQVLFESNGTIIPFDYYTDGSIEASGALKNMPAVNISDVSDSITNNMKVYLVDYLVDISDPKRFVSQKLIQNGYSLTKTYNFTGVGYVYEYQR